MGWLLLIIVVVFLGLWLWNIRQGYIARQRQQLLEEKITEVLTFVGPVVEKAYEQLTRDIRSRWPLISFDFPTLDNILTNSKHVLAGYAWHDIGRLTKKLLNPVVLKGIADFMAYRPDFVVAANAYTISSDVDESPTTNEVALPPDWAERRKIAHDRDGGHCRRCGINVPLHWSHIHHIVRKSKGGGHSIDNLVTLCRECHSLMPEHEIVTGGPFFVHRFRDTLHTQECYHALGAMKVSGSLPVLLARGYEPCQKCMPMAHRTLWIERFARSRLSSIVNSLVLEREHQLLSTAQQARPEVDR